MSQQTHYYSANRPPTFPQGSASSASSSSYPVRPLPTPGSSSTGHSPYSPPTSATSSKSPPPPSASSTSYSGGRYTSGNVQSPEAIDDAQRWGSPSSAQFVTGRSPSGGGSMIGVGSFQHPDSATSPKFHDGFEQSLRGAGGYRDRREGSNGSIVSPTFGGNHYVANSNQSSQYTQQPHSASSSVSSLSRQHLPSSVTPQPSAPPRSASRSPSSSPVHGASPSPTTSRSPLRRSTSSVGHEPLPAGTFITATADHESLSVVPLSGLTSVEAIKEIIMSRLHISDEDMPQHEFYLTRIGGGEGRRVGDEELWESVRANSGQVTVFVKDLGRRGSRPSNSGRGGYEEDNEDDFGVGMSAERMRQVSHRRERQRQKSSSISSRSEASIDEFGQPTGQRLSPGGTERLRSDRPSWPQQSASWGHSSRGVSASEGTTPGGYAREGGGGGSTYAASPPMERSRSGGSTLPIPRERENSNGHRLGSGTSTGAHMRDEHFSPPPRQVLPQGSNQVVMGPSGPTRRLPPQPSPSLDLPDHAEMAAHNQLRQRIQTAPSIQVSSPFWNQTIVAPLPVNMPLPPSPQPASTHQVLTRPPGPGTSPQPSNPRAFDPRSNLPQYTSQPYKNLPLPNSPYHNLSLQSSYHPGSSTVGITYSQASPSAPSKPNGPTPYNVQQQDRLSAQQKMMSKSADNLRANYSTSPQAPSGFDHSRPPVPPPIPSQYLSTVPLESVSSPSNPVLNVPHPPPASAFYSSPVQAQHQAQARSYTSPAFPQTAVPRRPPVDQIWNQPRPSTMYDLSTGQVELRPGEVLQQTYASVNASSGVLTGGGGPRKRSDQFSREEVSSPGEGRRRESSGSTAPTSGTDERDRRRSRDGPLKSQLPSSLISGGGSRTPSSSSPSTTNSPKSASIPSFADDDGLYDGIASPDRYNPTPSTRSSASASGPLTPAGETNPFIPIPTTKSSANQGHRLDEFGDPIDEETSTWFPVGQVQSRLSSSLSSGGHPSPFSPTVHSPLAKASMTVPLPASSPYAGPASSPMKQQYSSSSSDSAPMTEESSTRSTSGGVSSARSTRDRSESIPNAQDWQQTILSRFGASNLSDGNEESTLMASGTLRPFDTSGTLAPAPKVGLGVGDSAASQPATPKLVDEFGDELEDDATFFPGFGPAGASSTPQGQSLRLDGMYPSSPTSPHHKRPNLRVTIEGSPGGSPDSRTSTKAPLQSTQQQQQQRSSEPSPPSGNRSSRKAHNPRLDELVRFASPGIGRRNSFAAREKDEKDWAIRPPVETVLENLDVFFPEHDLDKPVFDLPTPSTGTPSTGSSPVREAPPLRTNRNGSNGATATGGPLGYRKSIRVVAQDRKRMLQKAGNNVARAVSGLGSNLLRRRSTKLFGARIEEVTSAQMKNINAIKETSDDDPDNFSYKWIKGDLIGRGTYGHVYIALSVTTGETIAVKQVEMPRTYSDKEDQRTKGMISSLKAEIELLKDLDHPNIVLYLGMEQTHEFLSIFLEYVPGGSVGRIIRTHGKFEENVIKFFTLQILDGLEYLHSLGILHRDMKADNILIDQDGMCKISDFGTSKKSGDIYQNNENMSMQGSIFWMAPEVIHNNKQGYSAKADIWSLGCICIEMLAGSRPWEGEGFMGAMFKLGAERMRPPLPDDVERSAFAEEFVSNCLQIEPDRRPKASEAKHHPFLSLSTGWSFTQTSLYHVMTSDRLPSTPSASS